MSTERTAPMPSPVPQRPAGSSRPRRISSSPPGSAGTILLDAVPEDESSPAQTLPRRPSPPSSSRSVISVRQRAGSSRHGDSSASGSGSQNASARQRAPWVFDILESQDGAAEWAAKHRVVLVLGDVTADTLRPLLHDPCFGDTLVLVGTPEPIAEIETLLSSYHIRDKHDGTHIYPRVQALSLSTRKGRSPAPVHPLPELLAKATEAAKAFLAKSSRRPSRSWASSDSVSPLAPPGSVPMRTRTSSGNSLGRVSSRLSTASGAGADAFEHPARPGLSSSCSSSSLASSAGRPQGSRVSSFRRDSMMNLRAALDGPSTVVVPGQAACPFDAVVNVVPDPKAFGSQQAMHGMLHQTVVLTTGIMPVLSRKSPRPVAGAGGAIPLVHVLPPRAPPALPTVIENYLLALLPSFQSGDRPVWAGVVSDRAWRAASIGETLVGNSDGNYDVNGSTAVSGAQAILFGGLRCPVELTKTADGATTKPRAFLGSWKDCLGLPGLLRDAAGPAAQAQLARAIEHTAQMAEQAARSAPAPAPMALSPRTSRLASAEQVSNGGRMRSRLSAFVINSDDLPSESPEIESQHQTPFFEPEAPMPELMPDSARGSASSASSSSSALNESSAFSSRPPSARSLRPSQSASSDGSHGGARMPAWGKGHASTAAVTDQSAKGKKKGFMGWFQSKKRVTVVTA